MSLKARLLHKMISDFLEQKFFDALTAGIDFELNQLTFGFTLTIVCFPDQLSKFLGAILQEILNFEVDQKLLSNYIDLVQKEIKNYSSKKQYQIVGAEATNFFSKFFSFRNDQEMITESQVF